jgi:hypothetical protein
MVRYEVNMNNIVQCSRFKVHVKVKQFKDYFYSYTIKTNNIKEQWVTWQWNDSEMKQQSQVNSIMRYTSKGNLCCETMEEKKSETYEFWDF